MDEKFKEAKEWIKAVMQAVMSFEKALEDKNISWAEGFALIPILKEIFEESKDFGLIFKELKEAGAGELDELYEYAKVELDLKHDLAEAYVERSILILINVYEMFLIRKK